MSDPAASKRTFIDLWSDVSVLYDKKMHDRKTDKHMPVSSKLSVCRDLQSPKSRGCSRYLGWNNADSPGDVEPTQDIFWDPTSPTSAGYKNTRVVEISDIVNRIAPKDKKQRGADSPLLQWIGDSAVPCTPDIPKLRIQKKSTRQSSVDDLVKLARQFDRNMQQDGQASREPYTDDDRLGECGNTTEATFSDNVKALECPSSSDQVEAELNALFDCSTQKVSGRLSLGSSPSANSQEVESRPLTSNIVASQQLNLETAGRSNPAADPDQGDESCSLSANHYDGFDDDWENDDLFDDSLVLALTHNPEHKHDTALKTTLQASAKTNATQFASVCKPVSAQQPSDLHAKPSCSTLRDLCFKGKTTNRSTFKLESRTAAKKPSDSSSTGIQPKLQSPEQNTATSKTLSVPQPDKIGDGLKVTSAAAAAVKDVTDSLWDNRNDDALLYQVCDSVERISYTQPQLDRPGNCQEKQDVAGEAQRGTAPTPIDTAWAMDAVARKRRRSPCAFVLSHSLPGTSCESVNYQGWNIPMSGANNNSRLSQSFPGSHASLGTFNQHRDASGNAIMDLKPHTVAARGTRKSCHTAFKRNEPDPVALSNKVFVMSQTAGKCSAAEIERKKQEALARRRQRMQNVQKS